MEEGFICGTVSYTGDNQTPNDAADKSIGKRPVSFENNETKKDACLELKRNLKEVYDVEENDCASATKASPTIQPIQVQDGKFDFLIPKLEKLYQVWLCGCFVCVFSKRLILGFGICGFLSQSCIAFDSYKRIRAVTTRQNRQHRKRCLENKKISHASKLTTNVSQVLHGNLILLVFYFIFSLHIKVITFVGVINQCCNSIITNYYLFIFSDSNMFTIQAKHNRNLRKQHLDSRKFNATSTNSIGTYFFITTEHVYQYSQIILIDLT
ncbi:hypothetical protein Hanom_Chr01g00080851 [Helianthus anomalus]